MGTMIRIIRQAGELHLGTEFEIDEQVARELVGKGIAEIVQIVEDTPARVTTEIKTTKRK